MVRVAPFRYFSAPAFVSTSTGSAGAGSAAGSFDGDSTTSADVALESSTTGSAVSDATS